jgi:hypothetical protein
MSVSNGCLTLNDSCYLWTDYTFNIKNEFYAIFAHKGMLNVMIGPKKEAWTEDNDYLQSISLRIEDSNKLWVKKDYLESKSIMFMI